MLNSSVKIRPFHIKDFIKLHTTYDHASEQLKKFFGRDFMGFKNINIKWLIRNLALLLSSNNMIRKILHYKMRYLSLIAINEKNNEIIGFCYLKINQKITKYEYSAVLGIFVKEKYQNMGIGTEMMKSLINLGKQNNIKCIRLTVHIKNVRAIKFYIKNNFTPTLRIGNVLEMEKWL